MYHRELLPIYLNFRWSAVSTLLQNPMAVLTSLSIECAKGSEYGLPLIAASLIGNTRLKHLTVSVRENVWEMEEFNLDVFGPVLCDSSSIESTCNSNHMLQNIDVIVLKEGKEQRQELPMLIEMCLILNKISKKEDAIRNKIDMFYFVGNFDVSPFARMPISLIPRAIGLIKCSSINRMSVIYRLLGHIPDLLNVSDREAASKLSSDFSSMEVGCLNTKRQKIGNYMMLEK